MADQVDFAREADDCFRLAEFEMQPEVKTILMGMAYGWLTLADYRKASSERHREPIEEPTEEPVDDLVQGTAASFLGWAPGGPSNGHPAENSRAEKERMQRSRVT